MRHTHTHLFNVSRSSSSCSVSSNNMVEFRCTICLCLGAFCSSCQKPLELSLSHHSFTNWMERTLCFNSQHQLGMLLTTSIIALTISLFHTSGFFLLKQDQNPWLHQYDNIFFKNFFYNSILYTSLAIIGARKPGVEL